MKLPVLLSFCLAVLAATGVYAQDAPDDPKGGTLVDCGLEKIAVFARTESPDGRYALGWTIRPKPGQPPVDWSAYDRNDPGEFLGKYPLSGGDMATVMHTLVDGVLDLRAGRFTPLVGAAVPFWPHSSNKGGLGVAWSGSGHGTRYAIVGYDGRFSTISLWLVTIRAESDVHVTDLGPAATRAVMKSLATHIRQSERYEVTFVTSYSPNDGKPTYNPFKGLSLKLHFDAAVPKGIDDRGYEGEVTISLPGGTVTHVRSRVSS